MINTQEEFDKLGAKEMRAELVSYGVTVKSRATKADMSAQFAEGLRVSKAAEPLGEELKKMLDAPHPGDVGMPVMVTGDDPHTMAVRRMFASEGVYPMMNTGLETMSLVVPTDAPPIPKQRGRLDEVKEALRRLPNIYEELGDLSRMSKHNRKAVRSFQHAAQAVTRRLSKVNVRLEEALAAAT